MAEKLLKKYRFIKLNNAVYVWTGHYYRFIDSNRLEELCTREYYDIFIETGSSSLLKAIIKFIVPMIPESIVLIDASHLIMFNNGAFDLNTGGFTPYSPNLCNYFIRHSVNADFLNLCCEVTNSHEDYIIIGELFKMFGLFCEQNGYRNNYSCNAFSKAIKQLVPASATKKIRIGTSTANARTCIRIAEQT